MFFKITDNENDTGYVNLNSVEFIRKDLNGSLTFYYGEKTKPLKLSSESSKEILAYLERMNKLN